MVIKVKVIIIEGNKINIVFFYQYIYCSGRGAAQDVPAVRQLLREDEGGAGEVRGAEAPLPRLPQDRAEQARVLPPAPRRAAHPARAAAAQHAAPARRHPARDGAAAPRPRAARQGHRLPQGGHDPHQRGQAQDREPARHVRPHQ